MFGPSGCILAKVVEIAQKVVLNGKKILNSGRLVVFGQKRFSQGKVVVLGQKWLYLGKSGYILA